MLAQVAEGRDPGEPGPLEPRVGIAVDELDGGLKAESPADPGGAGQRLADDQRHGLRIHGGAVATERSAHVAAAAPVEGFRLVTEVTEDRVVTAASALHPADQLEELAPLVLHDRGIGGGPLGAALEEHAPQRQIAGAHEEEPGGDGAVAARAS